MRRFLHAWWPVAAVVVFTAVLVLQIPRKALFFKPVAFEASEPFVSFVAFGDEEYAQLVRSIRMAWQMRPISGDAADSSADTLDFTEPLPPPEYLPLRNVSESASPPAFKSRRSALMPPSLGLKASVARPAEASRASGRDPDLLAIPAGLAHDPPLADFTLKNPRSIK